MSFLDVILGHRPKNGICEDARSFRRLLHLNPGTQVRILIRNNNPTGTVKGVSIYAPSSDGWEWQTLSCAHLSEVFPEVQWAFPRGLPFTAQEFINFCKVIEVQSQLLRPIIIAHQFGHGDLDQASVEEFRFDFKKAA